MSKRKLWTDESMEAAIQCIHDGSKGLRETARLYNIPVETLRRHAIGECEYLIKMSEMGFGLNRETVMEMAYKIVNKTGRKHPFKNEKAGRAWFEGFQRRHPNLMLRKPQPLSYCRAASSNQETIEDFFGKLGAIYGRLNLISKPMYIYNVDETGISVVHKPPITNSCCFYYSHYYFSAIIPYRQDTSASKTIP